MHRIDSSTATPDNKFTEGDPTIPVAATTVTADWLNSVQEELVKVVTEAGLELDKPDTSQLWQAIVKIIGVKAPIATTKAPGLVQVGSGLDVTAAGLLSVLVATAARAGIIKPDGTSLTVDKNGVLSVIQKADATVTELDFLRKLSIGRPVWHTSTTLPDRHMWVNGDLIDFDAHPEFGEKFEAGGFAGLVMPWDADAEYQAAHLGQFRPNSANPSAVFSPLHGGQFFRNWALGVSENAGTYNAPGLPELTGEYASQEGCNAVFTAKELSGVFTKGTQRSGPVPGYTSGSYAAWKLKFLASGANGLYGASDTVMPPSIDMPVIFYLGRRGK